MIRRLAIAAVLMAGLSGCQAAIYAGITFGMTVAADALGISAAIKDNLRAATGQCVSLTFKLIPCPPRAPEPAPNPAPGIPQS